MLGKTIGRDGQWGKIVVSNFVLPQEEQQQTTLRSMEIENGVSDHSKNGGARGIYGKNREQFESNTFATKQRFLLQSSSPLKRTCWHLNQI